jgi:hypothetical protein
MERVVISFYFKIIMKLYNIISRTKVNYLIAPDNIINDKLKVRMLILVHFIPTFIFSIILTVFIFPKFSATISQQLEDNSSIMIYYELFNWILISFIMGFVIEKLLEYFNDEYKEYKKININLPN